MIRILADENLHADIVGGLRAAGQDVTCVPAVGLAGHSDRAILEYAESRGMVVISGDKDFGGLVEFGTLWGRGKVVLLRYRLLNIGRAVADILEALRGEGAALRDRGPVVVVLSEGRYRVHKPGRR